MTTMWHCRRGVSSSKETGNCKLLNTNGRIFTAICLTVGISILSHDIYCSFLWHRHTQTDESLLHFLQSDTCVPLKTHVSCTPSMLLPWPSRRMLYNKQHNVNCVVLFTLLGHLLWDDCVNKLLLSSVWTRRLLNRVQTKNTYSLILLHK